ncbi:nucleoside phosphorylase domain-containing protein [Aspergillus fruticulosus]
MSDPDQYTVGWICALETEYVAARAFLEKKHSRPQTISPNDNNLYTLGEIGGHQVVIAVLPDGEYGTSSAASVARDMVHSFPNIRFGLMVGIGGGVPTKHDIRLGDIIVSSSRNGRGGLLQYNLGKELQGQEFHQTGFLNQPPPILRTAVAGLQVQYEEEGHQLKESIQTMLEGNKRLKRKYAQPPSETDQLFESVFAHPNLEGRCGEVCDSSKLVRRPTRTDEEDDPAIHYGLIASGNRLIEDATFRDRLAAEQDVLCFEMEAAGLMNHFPCLVIRGVCDYADSHKTKEWQGWAAMMAAAYARDLLYQIIPQRVKAERKAREVLDGISSQLDNVSKDVHYLRSITSESAQEINALAQNNDLKGLAIAAGAEFGTYMNQHEAECFPGTRKELLHNIQNWAASANGKCIFWPNGLTGRDFLLDSNTCDKTPFWVNKEEMNQILSDRCLSVMRKKLKKNICSLKSYGTERRDIDPNSINYYLPPELRYSCRYWVYHLADCESPMSRLANIQAFLNEHFLHWVEVMSILGVVSEVLGSISTLQEVLQVSDFCSSNIIYTKSHRVVRALRYLNSYLMPGGLSSRIVR